MQIINILGHEGEMPAFCCEIPGQTSKRVMGGIGLHVAQSRPAVIIEAMNEVRISGKGLRCGEVFGSSCLPQTARAAKGCQAGSSADPGTGQNEDMRRSARLHGFLLMTRLAARLIRQGMKKILFVCLGNICRSPAAEGIFRQKAAQAGLEVYVDSAGTGAWHVGKAPDHRMVRAAARRGIDLSKLQAREVDPADFYEFDFILAMDLSNQSDLFAVAPGNRDADIRLFLDFSEGPEREVPDPYYGGNDGFERVLSLLEDACDGFLRHLENEDD